MSAITRKLYNEVHDRKFPAQRLLDDYVRDAVRSQNPQALKWSPAVRHLFEDIFKSALPLDFYRQFAYGEGVVDLDFIQQFDYRFDHELPPTFDCSYAVARCIVKFLQSTGRNTRLTIKMSRLIAQQEYMQDAIIVYLITSLQSTLIELNITGSQTHIKFKHIDLFALLSTMPNLRHLSMDIVTFGSSETKYNNAGLQSLTRIQSFAGIVDTDTITPFARFKPVGFPVPPSVRFLQLVIRHDENRITPDMLITYLKTVVHQNVLTLRFKLAATKRTRFVKLLPLLADRATYIALIATEPKRDGERTHPVPTFAIFGATDTSALTGAVQAAHDSYVEYVRTKVPEEYLGDSSDDDDDYY